MINRFNFVGDILLRSTAFANANNANLCVNGYPRLHVYVPCLHQCYTDKSKPPKPKLKQKTSSENDIASLIASSCDT